MLLRLRNLVTDGLDGQIRHICDLLLRKWQLNVIERDQGGVFALTFDKKRKRIDQEYFSGASRHLNRNIPR